MRRPRSRLPATATASLVALLLGACASSPPEDVLGVYELDGERVEATDIGAHASGLANLAKGRYGLALDDLKQALRLDPTSIETLNAIAICYDRLGRHDLAFAYYQRALAFDQGSAQTLNNLARSLLVQGRPEEALLYLKRIESGVADKTVIANLALASAAVGRTSGAIPLAADEPVGADQPKAWIERNSKQLQTLVTTAELDLGAALAARSGLDPALLRAVAYTPAAATPAAITVVPGVPWRSATPEPQIEVEALAPPPGLSTSGAAEPDVDTVAATILASAPANLPDQPRPGDDTTPLLASLVVSNGTGREAMAARLATWLAGHGLPRARLTNADSFDAAISVLSYRPGFEAEAERMAAVLPHRVTLAADAGLTSDLRLLLGDDLLEFDDTLLASHPEMM